MAAFDDMLRDLGRRFPATTPGRFLIMRGWARIGTFILSGRDQGADLELIHIDPAHRKRGVGSHVLQAICAAADARHVDLELLVMPQDPEMAFRLVSLYRRHRFIQIESDLMRRFCAPMGVIGPLPCPANEDRAPRRIDLGT